MRAVIFVNGHIADYNHLRQHLRDDDYLIGADGGTRHCLALGRTPDVVVGDLDSLSAETVKALEGKGVAIERHPPVKNETDIELALSRAVHDGADAVLLVGALGNRLDQTLGNLLILAREDWSVPVTLVEGRQRAQIVRGGESITLHGATGSIVSAIPLSPQAVGITYGGLRYPLINATLEFGSTRGISNELAEETATVEIREGILLVTVQGEA